VDISGRRVRDDDLLSPRADQWRDSISEALAVPEPRRVGFVPPADRQLTPLFEHPLDRRFGRSRERSQRIAVHVGLALGDHEALAEACERVLPVAALGVETLAGVCLVALLPVVVSIPTIGSRVIVAHGR
jgi:hypothetical protein